MKFKTFKDKKKPHFVLFSMLFLTAFFPSDSAVFLNWPALCITLKSAELLFQKRRPRLSTSFDFERFLLRNPNIMDYLLIGSRFTSISNSQFRWAKKEGYFRHLRWHKPFSPMIVKMPEFLKQISSQNIVPFFCWLRNVLYWNLSTCFKQPKNCPQRHKINT